MFLGFLQHTCYKSALQKRHVTIPYLNFGLHTDMLVAMTRNPILSIQLMVRTPYRSGWQNTKETMHSEYQKKTRQRGRQEHH